MTNHPILTSFAFAFIGIAALGVVMLFPTSGEKLALVFPINTSEFESFERVANAGGAIIKHGGTANFIVASFPNKPIQEVKEMTGALLVLNADNVSSCFGGELSNGFSKRQS